MKRAFAYYAGVFLSSLGFSLAQPILSVDVSARSGPGDVAAGFNPFVMTPVNASFQASVQYYGDHQFVVTRSAADYEDRSRATLTSDGSFSSALYRDFIFTPDASGASGIQISIGALTPGQVYNVSLWSYDSGSAGRRVSDWSVNYTVVHPNYTFDGRVLPTSDLDYRMDFTVAATPTGNIMIAGFRDMSSVDEFGAPAPGVYFNALKVTAVPEPGVYALLVLGGALFVTARFKAQGTLARTIRKPMPKLP